MTERIRVFLRAAAVLTALVIAAGPGVAGQTPATKASPTPAEIFARHLKAIGGESAQKSIRSIHAKGTFEMPAQGVSGPFEAISARPAKMLMKVDVPAVGHVESGYDGKVGWEIDPATGPSVAAGRKLSELADDAFFDSPLHGPTFVKSATLVGQELFDKRPAYKIQVTLVSGNEQTEYYDVETGLLLGSEAQRETPLGVVPTISILRDYKKFGSLMQATALVSRTMGIEQIVKLTSIEYNTVPANAFDLPPQIKALIGR